MINSDIDWCTIESVFFDMDGTLLDLRFDNYIWLEAMPNKYAKIHNTTLSKAKEHIKKYINEVKGTLKAYCFDYWSNFLGFEVIKLHLEEKDKIQYRSNAENLLIDLNKKGYIVFIATNAHPNNFRLTRIGSHSSRLSDVPANTRHFTAY
ncbi:GMP/IMP nucleotidase YrfG (plasmid) [Piscirickettsia salmonis]|uniref:HAD hydrolase-like protein n=1 Tax=Piscirickettsia salmonis TaxID=1238 RepID=UPI0012BB0C4A|nr:HAD hydrolase-like protein [Piscirickettsia salmonis]QGP57138.1 GMP/IMP nucleotidase YrfG [Piscirickettsia salmonis]QGP66692.1 GMP/IMP nucleotidase YrfG [Piscirickettsia salmonis]